MIGVLKVLKRHPTLERNIGESFEELLSVADRRMYSEKHSHREQASASSRVVHEREHSGNVLVN